MSWLKDLGEASKAEAAARLSAGKSKTGGKLKAKADGDPGALGGSIPSLLSGGSVEVRDEGYTVTYPAKVQWFQQGSKARKQPARRVVGLSKDEIQAHRDAAGAELRRVGRRMGVFL